jgi:hypothetical protein
LPTPLAVNLVRLAAALDRQEPVAAAWQLRDSFECLLKFTAVVAQAQDGALPRQTLLDLLDCLDVVRSQTGPEVGAG